ncbi:hypothetical protein [Tumebacillus flagellatus]|uniref:Uncharacterized protein n=1 Tax=Tumebacillus flagellatus TaxID=1157490 RepID=A0A074LRN5_9BACL|nr:hypothetical protein [Tumebacillus flagellatus]KEO82503.1 hypothetical protein EL26_14790 [Tumebacillus flagellatus]
MEQQNYLASISKSLETLVKVEQQKNELLKSLVEHLAGKEAVSVLDTTALNQVFEQLKEETMPDTHYSLTAELFLQVSKVYLDEERLRVLNKKKKKAARRVSINLGNVLEDFFQEYLEDEAVLVERAKDGLIVFKKHDRPLATLKFFTDMGFLRGDYAYQSIQEIVDQSQTQYGVPNDRVFIVVCSLLNSIDKKHVEDLVGKIDSNWEFLNNHEKVADFVTLFTERMTALEHPKKQVYFMASELHPNVLGDELYHAYEEQRDPADFLKQVETYNWLSDLTDLVQELNAIV